MEKEIKSSSDLRRFVCSAMSDVRYGHLSVDKGQSVAKLAAQVNESLRIELMGYKLMLESGATTQSIGDLPLTIGCSDEKV